MDEITIGGIAMRVHDVDHYEFDFDGLECIIRRSEDLPHGRQWEVLAFDVDRYGVDRPAVSTTRGFSTPLAALNGLRRGVGVQLG